MLKKRRCLGWFEGETLCLERWCLAWETTLLANGHLKFSMATQCLVTTQALYFQWYEMLRNPPMDCFQHFYSIIYVNAVVRQSFQSTMQWRQRSINSSFSANRKLDWSWQSVGGIGSLQLTVFWQKPACQSDGRFSSVYCLLLSCRTCIPHQTWLNFLLH